MPSQWDHKADKDLLLAIIEEGSLKTIMWPQIAEKMKTKDYTFTHEACRQHFQKIRKESKSGTSPNKKSTTAPSTPNPKTTPHKISKASASKTPSFSASKSSSFSNSNNGHSFNTYNDNDDDDEDDFAHTPIKRQRVIKKEDGQENGYGFAGMQQSASLFKVEDLSAGGRAVVDLENDDIYEI